MAVKGNQLPSNETKPCHMQWTVTCDFTLTPLKKTSIQGSWAALETFI